ncbi:MAG: acyl-CoA dehydrogenase family protein [Solirubrobacteraceae bacterium]
MTMTTATHLPLVADDEELALREAVAGICRGFGPGYARACFDRGEPMRELWRALGDAGFVGANIPEEWGGGGLGMRGLAIVAEESAAAGAISIMLVLSSGMAGTMLARHGTDAQKDRWLREIAAGTTKLAFAITEPDAGTNSHNLRTELRRDGDRYLLTGQKTFISGVEDAEAVLVVARVRNDAGELGPPSLCIVDTDAPGFQRDAIPMPYMGPDQQWTLFFDDVVIDADRIVGGEDAGLRVLFDALNPERISIAAGLNGTARLALEKATAYAREREVWGAPIGSHQAVAHPLAHAKIHLELARLMTEKAAVLFDAAAPGAGDASNMAKYAAAEAATQSVDHAIQTHGGNGFTIEYGLSDLWWFTRLMRTAPVSEQMILNHTAQHSLGLPRSY